MKKYHQIPLNPISFWYLTFQFWVLQIFTNDPHIFIYFLVNLPWKHHQTDGIMSWTFWDAHLSYFTGFTQNIKMCLSSHIYIYMYNNLLFSDYQLDWFTKKRSFFWFSNFISDIVCLKKDHSPYGSIPEQPTVKTDWGSPKTDFRNHHIYHHSFYFIHIL